MTRKTVLLVDDEEPILFGLHKVLHKDNESIDVLIARTGEIAKQIISSHAVDVLVTDVRMPGISGLELLCWAAAESPSTRGIIMTAFDTSGLECDAYRCGCLQIVQKPFDLHQMRSTVLAALDDSHAFRGSLTSLSPADVVQMLCLSRRTNVLRVVEGADSGVVHIRKGEVVHAVWNQLIGEEAFYQLVCAKDGIFDTLPLPAEGPVTIEAGWQHLLIEAMRLEDEERAGVSTATPGTTASPKSTTKLTPSATANTPAAPRSTTQLKTTAQPKTVAAPMAAKKATTAAKPKPATPGKTAATPTPIATPRLATSGKTAASPTPIAKPKLATSTPIAKPKPATSGKTAAPSTPIAMPKPATSGKIAATSTPIAMPEPTTSGKTAATPTPVATPKPAVTAAESKPNAAAASSQKPVPKDASINATEDDVPPSSRAAAWDAAVNAAKAQPVSKEDVPELIDKGFSLVQKRRYDEAKEAWRSALDLDPGNRMLELNLRRLEAMKDRK